MMRTAAPAILPTGKSISGRLLNNASEKVEVELKKLLQGKMIGIVDDGWKGAKKEQLVYVQMWILNEYLSCC